MYYLPAPVPRPRQLTPDRLERAALTLAAAFERIIEDNRVTWTAAPDAPDTYERLTAECTPHRLIVWDGATDTAVYPAALDNHRYRVCHDRLHILLSAPFTVDGEHRTALAGLDEIAHALKALPVTADEIRDALALFWAESWGQVHHVQVHGDFPANQRTFDAAYAATHTP